MATKNNRWKWGDRFLGVCSHDEASKKQNTNICRRTNESKQVGERQDPPEQVKVMLLPCFLCGGVGVVVFSIWFRMVWLRFCFQIL